MRILLAGVTLLLLPSLAHAQCTCTCMRGQSVPVCASASLVQPICQQICTDKVDQSLTPPSLSAGSAAGSGGAAAAAAAGAGIDPSVARALLGR